MDEKDFVTHDEFGKEIEKIRSVLDEQNKRITNNDIQITQISTLYENLKDLPSALNGVKETMVKIQMNMERMADKVETAIQTANEKTEQDKIQDDRIKKLENKSKVDIIDFIRENWWKICLGLATGIVLLKDII